MFELSLRYPVNAVTTVAEIAKIQDIPPRFLEQIFSKLRTGGYIESRRGNLGGYSMTVAPSGITVGEIIRFIEGSEESVECIKSPEGKHCKTRGGCVFKDLWLRAKSSMSDIFDGTSFQDLVDKHKSTTHEFEYTI